MRKTCCLFAALFAATPAIAQVVSPAAINERSSRICAEQFGSETKRLCITRATNKVDVFLLFDDTGSFASQATKTKAVFNDMVTRLQAALPDADLAFGVGRFEDYGGSGHDYSNENTTGRPFTLNQAIVRTHTAGFSTLISNALSHEAPGFGGDGPETAIEGLWQVATGVGFDGNGDGDTTDSGSAGATSTQTNPGRSGDVPAFSTHDGPRAGDLGGVGWRSDAMHFVILATDASSVVSIDAPAVPATITGLGGHTEPSSAFASSNSDPGYKLGFVSNSKNRSANTVVDAVAPLGACDLQKTVDAMNALDIRVIGMAPNGAPTSSTNPSGSPSTFMSALARLTGAVNAAGQALVFPVSTDPTAVLNAIVNVLEAVPSGAMDVIIESDASLPGLAVSFSPAGAVHVPEGESACF